MAWPKGESTVGLRACTYSKTWSSFEMEIENDLN